MICEQPVHRIISHYIHPSPPNMKIRCISVVNKIMSGGGGIYFLSLLNNIKRTNYHNQQQLNLHLPLVDQKLSNTIFIISTIWTCCKFIDMLSYVGHFHHQDKMNELNAFHHGVTHFGAILGQVESSYWYHHHHQYSSVTYLNYQDERIECFAIWGCPIWASIYV